MTSRTKGKIATVALAVAAIAVMSSAVAYSPTLYRLFCAATGYGGATQRALAPLAGDAVGEDARTVTVSFDANVAPGLDWEFRPAQSSVKVKFGEPTQVYYYARNTSDKTVVAQASYNVTPGEAGRYFFKIQCFCFTRERLGPGEEAKMPLVFYVDKEMLNDENSRDIQDITLSYTFFKQNGLTPAEVTASRDLAAGSKEEIAEQSKDGVGSFSAEVRRQ